MRTRPNVPVPSVSPSEKVLRESGPIPLNMVRMSATSSGGDACWSGMSEGDGFTAGGTELGGDGEEEGELHGEACMPILLAAARLGEGAGMAAVVVASVPAACVSPEDGRFDSARVAAATACTGAGSRALGVDGMEELGVRTRFVW